MAKKSKFIPQKTPINKPFVRPSFMSSVLPSKKVVQKRGSSLGSDTIDTDDELKLALPSDEDARLKAAEDEFDALGNQEIEHSVIAASEPVKIDLTENMNAFQKSVPPVLSEIFSPGGDPEAKEKFLISALSLDQWSLGAIRELTMAGHEMVRRIADYHRSELAKAEDILGMGIPGMPGRKVDGRSISKGTYQLPHDPSKVWHGNGRPPNWIVNARNKGFDIENWRVK